MAVVRPLQDIRALASIFGTLRTRSRGGALRWRRWGPDLPQARSYPKVTSPAHAASQNTKSRATISLGTIGNTHRLPPPAGLGLPLINIVVMLARPGLAELIIVNDCLTMTVIKLDQK